MNKTIFLLITLGFFFQGFSAQAACTQRELTQAGFKMHPGNQIEKITTDLMEKIIMDGVENEVPNFKEDEGEFSVEGVTTPYSFIRFDDQRTPESVMKGDLVFLYRPKKNGSNEFELVEMRWLEKGKKHFVHRYNCSEIPAPKATNSLF